MEQSSASFFIQPVLSPGFLFLLIATPLHWLSRHKTSGSVSRPPADSISSSVTAGALCPSLFRLTAVVVPSLSWLLPWYTVLLRAFSPLVQDIQALISGFNPLTCESVEDETPAQSCSKCGGPLTCASKPSICYFSTMRYA